MKTLLITAIAGDIAQAIAMIVREVFPEWRILGCDVHERHGSELVVDKSFVAPTALSPQYHEWMETLVGNEGIDLCLPMSEAELRHFANKDVKQIAGAKLVMPNAEAIEVGGDKLATVRYLESVGCPAPWTLSADERQSSIKFPCVFKPRRGAGSKGVFVCGSPEEVSFLVGRYPHAVLQELLLPDDQEVTCAIYRANDGRIAILQLLRKLVGGFTGWARVINSPDVLSQCTLLAESLDLRGSINVQLRLTDSGPRIFEINSRFSSTVLMRHRMGYHDVAWALQEAIGESINLHVPPVNTTAVRTQGAALVGLPIKPSIAQANSRV